MVKRLWKVEWYQIMTETKHGMITQAISGFYDVETPDGDVIRTRARGQFRHKKKAQEPLVGDQVDFTMNDDGSGTIVQIAPRRNRLDRPPVANIDVALVTVSVREPQIPLRLIDRLLVYLETIDVLPVIYPTKKDLLENDEEHETVAQAEKLYQSIGYTVITEPSIKTSKTFADAIADKTIVVMGQSGVGKTTLLNEMIPDMALETGEVSKALGRGRHTTRHIALYHSLGGRWIDTPGFSSLDLKSLTTQNLRECFPEMRERQIDCKFRGCVHLNEPGCAVKQAVEAGEIAASRYQHYQEFYQELDNQKTIY